jgi:hypothetical protein
MRIVKTSTNRWPESPEESRVSGEAGAPDKARTSACAAAGEEDRSEGSPDGVLEAGLRGKPARDRRRETSDAPVAIASRRDAVSPIACWRPSRVPKDPRWSRNGGGSD